jgi:hypothetical protein
VLATREARAALPAMLERIRQDGADAEPVVIGARRRPEAVVLSYLRTLQRYARPGPDAVAALTAAHDPAGGAAPLTRVAAEPSPAARVLGSLSRAAR